jgi:uncharacterized membrane protein
MKKVNIAAYGLLAAAALLLGAIALVNPQSILPEAATSITESHLLREEGAFSVFLGLIAAWCIVNYERRRGVHASLLVFSLLISAIHWREYFAGHLHLASALYNSVLFVVLAVMAVGSRSELKRHGIPEAPR